MGRFKIAISILICIFIIICIELLYLNTFSYNFNQKVDTCLAASDKVKMEQSSEDLVNYFKKNRKFLRLLISENEVITMSETLENIKAYAKSSDKENMMVELYQVRVNLSNVQGTGLYKKFVKQ